MTTMRAQRTRPRSSQGDTTATTTATASANSRPMRMPPPPRSTPSTSTSQAAMPPSTTTNSFNQPSDVEPTTSSQSNGRQRTHHQRHHHHRHSQPSATTSSSTTTTAGVIPRNQSRRESSSSGGGGPAFASSTTATTTTTNTNTNTTTTLGERKSSFSVSTWMRDQPPLAEVADEVLHKQTTVWLAFQQIVFRTPDANALCTYDTTSNTTQSLTWRQLHTHVLSMVKVLVHLGLQVGDGVLFCAKSSFATYILHLATLAAGGVVCHLRNNWKPHELANDIFPNAKAKILVLDSLSDNFIRAIRTSSSTTTTPRGPSPIEEGDESSTHDVRAVVMLRGYSTERAIALNLPVSLLSMDEMRSVAQQCQAAAVASSSSSSSTTDHHLALLDRMPGTRVMPSDACLLSFDYDPHGAVRGTCVSHDNVMFTAANLAQSIGPLSFLDRLVAYLPLHHLASQVIEIFLPLLCGITVHCASSSTSYKGGGGKETSITTAGSNTNTSSNKQPLIQAIKLAKPTIFFATPDTWHHISAQVYKAKREVNSFLYKWAKKRATKNSKKLRFGYDAHRSLGYMVAKKLVLNGLQKKIGLESCKACYSVLAPLDFELEKLFTTIDIPIYQLYGVPECTGFASLNFPHSWEFGTCGRALKGTVMEYDDSTNEVLLRGRHVFMGYVKSHGQLIPPLSQGSAGRSDGPWLRIPQQGHLTPDGFLKINDPPKSFLVLSTGQWVPIEPFENALNQQPELDKAVLVGDGKTFLSVLLFMKTAASQVACGAGGGGSGGGGGSTGGGSSRGVSFSGAGGAGYLAGQRYHPQGGASVVLCDDAIRLGKSMGSHATTVADVIKCQRWAVHFDRVLETLPRRVGISGVQVRKWVLMAEEFTVDGGEVDPDTHEIKRRAVDCKYQSLLDSLYC